ncbi:hypothetical protein M9H77_28826 [Catharanthus roseus]|uniref:Uncharacterized protein n=1 Tax=Catharanthus roseus TaxID=4058 RepID=A0ACC0AJ65_CATRO|nr:hypothetical protein M9H77_28826 [Catharanthus roseus]
MQRVLSIKVFSKNLKNLSTNTQSISSRTFSFLSNPANSSHQRHGFFSKYTTLSSGQHNRVSSDKIPYGFFSNPALTKRLFQSTTLKDQSKGLLDSKVGFFRAQISRRNFQSNFSFDSNRRRWRSGFQRLTADGVVLGLILTNVGVFMLWHIARPEFMMKNFMISVDNFTSGRIHTLITCAFSHTEIWHLVANMVGLYFFGTSMGKVFGPEYLLKLYLAGALAGSVFYLVHQAYIGLSSKGTRVLGVDPLKAPALGASGAVNAIMLLDIFLFPKKTLYLDFIIPVPAVLLGIFLIGKDVLRILEGDSRISGSAHLGGAAAAGLAWLQVRKGRFRF